MSDFFRIERGLELDDLVQYLQGTGVPGAAGDTAAAPVGSVYTDNTDGSIWTKITSGAGTFRWQRMASETYVNNAVGATVSWREPAVVRDNVVTTVPTGTPTQPITVDGVSITNGQRVLFSAITGGNGKNVYIYDQASGLFVEDTNSESSGDAVYIQSGTSAGKTYVFNGSNWVLTDQASLDEEGYIRAFIGKDASGSEMPNYTSNNFAVDGTSLEAAIGSLDAELGPNVSLGNFVAPANKINQNIQALDTKLGANVAAGNHISPANTTHQNIQALDTQIGAGLLNGNFINLGDHLSVAITSLDNEIGPNVSNGNYILAANKINQNIQALDTKIGANVTNQGVILAANSVSQNIQALAAELAEVSTEVTVNNITSVQTVDSVSAKSAKWLVFAELVSDPTRTYSTEVFALQNGSQSDYTKYGTLRIGTAIPGLSITVDLNSGNLRLRAAATGAINVTARRVGTVV